jgi:PAS domain S-box-containing protein
MAELPWCGHKKVTLQEQRDFLSNVVNNIEALIVILDKDGRIIRYNKACEGLFGYTATEIELQLSSGLLPSPREIELVKALNDNLQAGQHVDQYEGRWMTKNGDLHTIVWSTTLLRDPDGAMEYILATGTDITQPKRVEEEIKKREQEFRMIADNIPGLVSYVDQDGCYRFANNGYKEWFGVTLEEIIGKHYKQVLGESTYSLIKDYVEAALSGQQVSFEEELPYRLGGTRWVFANYIPDVDERGKVKGFFALVTDITERKRMEEALRVSEQHFRALIEHSSDVIGLVNSNGTIVYESPSATRVFGFGDERIGQNALARIHPDDVQYAKSQFAQLLEQPGASFNVQVRFQHGDGTWHWTEATSTNLLAEPSVQAIVINSRDITEHKQAEEALVKEQHLLSALMDNLPDHIYFKDTESRFTRINKAQAEWLGLSDPAQAFGKTDFDFFLENHARPAYEDEQRIIRTGQPLVNKEERETWSDRPDTWVSTTKLPLRDKEGRIIGTFGVSRDITDHKLAEKMLERNQSLLYSLINSIPDLVFYKDCNGVYLGCNSTFEAFRGYKAEELIGHTDADFYEPERAREFLETDQRVISSGGSISYEHWTEDPQGNPVLIETRKTPYYGPDGELLGVIGVGRDITKHRMVENALRESKSDFEQLIASLSSSLIVFSSDLCITHWNPKASQILGFQASQVLGRPLKEIPIQWDWEVINENIDKCRNELRPMFLDPVRFKRLDGQDGYMGINISPIRGNEDQLSGYILLCGDITERKILENRLAQAHKLESIGQLAAGIAHEINTPIQYVGDNTVFLQDNYISLLKLLRKYDEFFSILKGRNEYLELITQLDEARQEADLAYLYEEIPIAIQQSLEGIHRVTEIVSAMKEFSHPGVKEKTALDINNAITHTLTVARNELKYVADVETDLDPNLPQVVCLPGEIGQVFLNIIVNAAHAIAAVVEDGKKGKGIIKICTRQERNWVDIRISDTGPGIPEENKPHIFEPFFTTKEVGKGTGQGLAMAYDVIERKHGGTITFETEIGKGTTFIIRLPVEPIPEKI